MKRIFSVHARISAAEFQGLNLLAQIEGVTVSELTRQFIHQSCKEKGVPVGLFGDQHKIVEEVLDGQPQHQ